MKTITLNLCPREISLLRNCTSDLGSAEVEGISLQLKIANALLDSQESSGDSFVPTKVGQLSERGPW
jgi:hypothetical protein